MTDKYKRFKWVGSPSPMEMTMRDVTFTVTYYTSFCLGDLLVSLNDDVLIRSSDDNDDSEDVENCFIGRVEILYERERSQEDDDCHRAVISWYSRPEELPLKHIRQFKRYPRVKSPKELFQNVQPFDKDIDAETIFGKCKVFCVSLDVSELSVTNLKDIRIPCFFTRLQYNGRTLTPIQMQDTHSVPRRRTLAMKEIKCTRNAIRRITNTTENSNGNISDNESSSSDQSEEIPLQYPIPTKITRTALRNKTNCTSPSNNDSEKYKSSPIKNFCQTSRVQTDDLSSQKLKLKSPKKVTPIKITSSHGHRTVSRIEMPVNSPKIRQSPRLKNDFSKNILKSDGVKRNLLEAIKDVDSDGCHEKKSSSQTRATPNKVTTSLTRKSIRQRYSSVKFKPAPRSLGGRSTRKKVDSSTSDDSSYKPDSSSDEIETVVNVKEIKRVSMKKTKTPTLTKLRTPFIPKRESKCQLPVDVLHEIQERLHVAAVPDALPCRENEFAEIYAFVDGKLTDGTGGCMYISGVPGTGKTATVHEVIRSLQEASENGTLPTFNFISINGMKLTEPRQAFVQIYKDLTGEKTTIAKAANLLEKRFRGTHNKQERIILLVDELDLLCTQKQDVMYCLFDWPNRHQSRLIVLAIANTMDLPERMMKNRVASRMGLTRLTFQPYNFKQLQTILMARLRHSDVFNSDAVQLVARKVAALSGDARRALDICRRATEIAAQLPKSPTKRTASLIGMQEVDRAIQEMFSLPKTQSIRNASLQEKTFLQAIMCEFQRTGLEEATFSSVYKQHCSLCCVEGLEVPNYSQAMGICYRLGSCRLLLLENGMKDIHHRIRLNISVDELSYALQMTSS